MGAGPDKPRVLWGGSGFQNSLSGHAFWPSPRQRTRALGGPKSPYLGRVRIVGPGLSLHRAQDRLSRGSIMGSGQRADRAHNLAKPRVLWGETHRNNTAIEGKTK